MLTDKNPPKVAPAQTQLVSHPENPAPQGAICGVIETPDNVILRYARWNPVESPYKGTVIVCQGRGEFIEKYFETAADLLLRGFGVVTFDWRGQGRSARGLANAKKGYVEDFSHYITDLEAVLDDVVLPDCKAPFFVLAHSFGGLVALMASPRASNRVHRMVLSCPLLELNGLPISQKMLQSSFAFLTFFGLGELYANGNRDPAETRFFDGNRITSDELRFQRNGAVMRAAPDLTIGGPTISWIFAACKAMEFVQKPEFMGTITIPTLLVAAGNDRVVSSKRIETYGERLRSGAHLLIPGAKHELLQEQDLYREQMLAAFDAFVPGSEE